MKLLRSRPFAALLAATSLAACARTPATQQPDAGSPDPWTESPSAGAGGVVEIPALFPRHAGPMPGELPQEPGLEFRLRERSAPAAPVGGTAPPPRPPATALGATQTAALLARLPALPADTAAVGFRFPPRTPPPPLTGATVLAVFPAPDTGAAPAPDYPAATAPLEVLRVVPEGETGLAPHLTITFSQPMVPLATLDALDARAVPVRLAPQPAGRWRWIDTRTLRFEPEGRFAMATEFAVEVPAGLRSATGGTLASPVRAVFATPAPRATGGYPHRHASAGFGHPHAGHVAADGFGLDPVVVLRFDQRVDAERVVRAARLRAGAAAHPLRLATAAEVDADSAARQLVDEAEPGQWVALRSARPLPRNAEIRLSLEHGALSDEGPRATEVRQELRFRTYGPLRVEDHGCGHRRAARCPPEATWAVRFSNLLDTLAWRAEHVRVTPEVEGLRVHVMGAVVMISGAFRPRTVYQLTLDPAIRDRWGQTLGASRTLRLDVGAPAPMVNLPGGPLIVLDPSSPARVHVHSRGHAELRVQLFRVRPDEWEAFSEAVARHRQDPRLRAFHPPGERIASTIVRPEGGAHGFSETAIDLAPALRQGLGHVIAVVEPTTRPAEPEPEHGWYDHGSPFGPAFAWVQSTRIGLAAAVDATGLLAWATSLENGAPLGGTELQLLPSGGGATTAADGTARIALSPAGDGVLVARRGDDAALLPDQEPGWRGRGGGSWQRREPRDRLAWYIASDRGLYRPGERVHLKGWIRRIQGGPHGDVGPAHPVSGVGYTVFGPRREELGSGDAEWRGLGGFDLAVDLPDELNLGGAGVQLRARGAAPRDNAETWHHVQVQEFRRPEFEVAMQLAPGPHLVGGTVDATATAAYYGGGGLPDTEIEWRVSSTTAQFTPPGWDGWQFGRAPWWWGGRGGSGTAGGSLRGQTDADGAHRLAVDLERAAAPFPHLLRTEAQVLDVNRQAGSASAEALVHPAEVYVGLRATRGWVRPGDSVTVEIVAVGIGGEAVAGRPVHVRAERLDWRPGARGVAADTAAVAAECRFVSAAEPLRCALAVREPGTLRVVAEVRDAQDRPNRTEWVTWVAGGPPPPPSPERPQTGSVGLVADRESYLPGQTAEVLVQPPFHPAEGVLTLRRAGLLHTERFRVAGPSHTLRIPLTEGHTPGVHAHVRLVGGERGVQTAVGEVLLEVSPLRRELRVEVTPRDTLARPGATTSVDLLVRGADGRAVPGAEVALWVVDESVLALGRYTVPDPLQVFHPQRGADVRDHETHSRVVLARRSAGPRTVSGIVVDTHTGTPLGGVFAVLPGIERGATTDAYGVFTITDVPPGAYRLRVGGDRFQWHETDVRVPEDGAHVGLVVLGYRNEESEQRIATPLMAELHAARGAAAPAPPAHQALLRSDVHLEEIVVTGGAVDGAAKGADAVALRADFAPLAAFEPSLRTGPDGRVRVPVRLPESLTRYRVVAVAVEGSTRYGRGEAGLVARHDLMVRPSAPRFLNFGDRAEIPVVVQNTTGAPLTVDVAVRASGLRLDGDAGRRVTVPARDRVELRFAVHAERAGTARVQAVGTSGARSDAAGVEFPVYTPATVEAFATYGELDTGVPALLPVEVPRGVVPGFGGLEVTVSSTALQALTDAVLYLHHYPFEAAEPIASRILAIAALRDVLGAFAADGLPSAEVVEAAAVRDIGRLAALQEPSGGWSLWRSFDRPHPYVSIHAAHALARARETGYRVPDEAVRRALEFLQRIEHVIGEEGYGPRERNSLNAYALYTRARLGDRGAAARAQRLAMNARPDELSVEAMAWLLHVLADDGAARTEAADLLRRIRNRASETAATATFATSYGERDYLLLHSSRRSDAVVLEALIAADPRSDLVAKTARGLLAHRTRGRWQGPQENAWVLLALARYFAVYEATTPDFRSGVWLAGRYTGGHQFRGRTSERHHVEVPMREVMSLARAGGTAAGIGVPVQGNGAARARGTGDADLLIHREGSGRMYYRAGLRYAPADLTPDATQRGFAVERGYEAMDDPADVRRDADGTWRVRAGARVRVRLSLVAPERRYHVALVDALPAGFEAVNPELAGVGFTDGPPLPVDPMPRPVQPGLRGAMERPFAAGYPGRGRWGQWWVHQNLRDDRAEAFATLLPAGVYEYTYIARATTPGEFVVPPARAEEMYAPETFGRGAGVRVIVEAR